MTPEEVEVEMKELEDRYKAIGTSFGEIPKEINSSGPEPELPTRPVHVALRETVELIGRFVLLPERKLSTLIAFWIVQSYIFKAFHYCGYLALRSATPGCGKTRLLRLVSMLSKGNPPITATPTAAALFRSTREVLILDEVDRLRNQDREVFGEVLAVLNIGFEAGGIVERVEKGKDGFQVKGYEVYGPKALAGLEALADTLSDRSFQIRMERTPERLARLNARRLEPLAAQIRRDFEVFAEERFGEVEHAYNNLPDELPSIAGKDDRFQDIAEPLLVLAAVIDSSLPEGEQPFLNDLLNSLGAAAGRREGSIRECELRAFLEIAEERLGSSDDVFISSSELLIEFQKREDLSRIETARALSGFLKHFDLFPGFNSVKTTRGYTVSRDWVNQWALRYRSDV